MQPTKKQFKKTENKMNELLALATKKGGFDMLSKKESTDLEKYTQIVNSFEATNYSIPLPETLQGLIELKMYENKLKQRELAQKLNITDTKLSEIMHKKRKPNISFLKSLHEVFNIDGNLLLRMV
jgi:HTH-type transcriptional regulator / antitoxin HigA